MMTVSSLPSILNVVCGLRRDLYPHFVVTMLKAFIDDSGSGGDSPWFVLAGFASTVERWAEFDVPWMAGLPIRDTEN
jgi:hypothetical protein